MRINEPDFRGDIIRKISILERGASNNGKKATFYYKNVVCAFDIETTRYKIGEKRISEGVKKDIEVGIMYVWQFQIGEDITVFGRTWEEFIELMLKIEYALDDDERLLVYVHNLSYEWNWLHDKNIIGDRIDEESVFMLDSRKILKFYTHYDKIEFRCSYIQSNMSLDEFTDKMRVEHKKLSGIRYDYNKIRFPWTPLTEYELQYCENDVIGLVECIYKEMEVDGDNLYTIPLTSTGYVRRELKEAKKKIPRDYYENMKPDYHTYKMLREAFRGGNCHANRWYSNKPYHGVHIGSADISSSYPNVLMNCKYPVTKFMIPSDEDARNTQHMFDLINNGHAVIARVALHGVKLHNHMWGCPYLSRDKCRNIKESEYYPEYKTIYDNGRIISCGYCETTATDIDLKIILSSYGGEYDMEGIDVIEYQYARYGELAEPLKDVIRKYFIKKTELKGNDLYLVQYNKTKNKINACYGIAAQDPGKINTIYSTTFEEDEIYREGLKDRKTGTCDYIIKPDRKKVKEFNDKHDKEGLDKYTDEIKAHNEKIKEKCYEKGSSTLPYQYGVWCTAWARYYLELLIRECGTSFIYCDTDSVYYDLDGKKIDFTAYNKERMKSSRKNGAYAVDRNGKMHYMGVAEIEHGDKRETIITDFITLGAKKYAWIDKKKGLVITVAGVSKRLGKSELMHYSAVHDMIPGKDGKMVARNPIDFLKPGFVFRRGGGNEIEYIDKSTGFVEIDGHKLYIPSCAVIKPSTYSVSLNNDYSNLLESSADELEQMRSDGIIDYETSILFAYPLDKIKKM